MVITLGLKPLSSYKTSFINPACPGTSVGMGKVGAGVVSVTDRVGVGVGDGMDVSILSREYRKTTTPTKTTATTVKDIILLKTNP